MVSINDLKILQFPQLGDDRGHLVVIEGAEIVPFEIKRVFYIYGSDESVVRGQHANKGTDFCLINVSGTSKVRVVDGNENQCIVNLDKPHYGVYLPHMLWKDMYNFSSDSVLLVLASTHYDGSEYLRDYDEFIAEAKACVQLLPRFVGLAGAKHQKISLGGNYCVFRECPAHGTVQLVGQRKAG